MNSERRRPGSVPAINPFRLAIILLFASLVSCLGLAGCSRDSVHIYESAPKTRFLAEEESVDSSELNFRMLAAIANRHDAAWFIKLAGPIADMSKLEPAWDELIQSIQFSDQGIPTWTLPEGWQTGEGSSMRFATLMAGEGDDALEVSVSRLPPNQDLLGNINRWRGQLGLPPTDPIQLEVQLKNVKTDTASFKVFDESGPIFNAGMGAPFMNAGGGQGTSQPPTPPTVPITYDAPSGWTPGETSSVMLDQWTKADGEAAVEIAVLQMNASDESWKMNISAWADQMDLAEEPDVDALTEQIEVANTTGRKIRIAQSENVSGQKSLVAVMFELDGTGWLLKYAGNTKLVDEHMATFDAFVASITRTEE